MSPSCLVARALAGSSRSTLRYSRIASRYCSRAAYLSPRSRYRVFCASGEREQPATRASATIRSVAHPRVMASVTPDPQSPCDVFPEAPEDVAHPLAHGLERGPAVANFCCVPPDELGDAVIDGAEEPAPAVLLCIEARGVGAPHLIRSRGGDRPRVGGIAVRRPQPTRGEQLVDAHQSQDTLAAEAEA